MADLGDRRTVPLPEPRPATTGAIDIRDAAESAVLNLKNRSHAVTAQVSVEGDAAAGVIMAQGGAFARQ